MHDIVGTGISYWKLAYCSSISPYLSFFRYTLMSKSCRIKFLVITFHVSSLIRCILHLYTLFRRASWFNLSRSAILVWRSQLLARFRARGKAGIHGGACDVRLYYKYECLGAEHRLFRPEEKHQTASTPENRYRRPRRETYHRCRLKLVTPSVT